MLGEKTELLQEELAKKAEITYSTLIKIETGANDNPKIKTLVRIAMALNVSVDSLISKKI